MSLITLEIGKLHDQHFEPQPQPEREQEQEDEALSLCDLPITKIVGSSNRDDENDTKGDDFDFNFYIGSSIESGNTLESSEMCSADEVFSGGQILPFRHSVSSEAGLSKTRNSGWRSVSRSESMDRKLGLGSRSSSTRSSSTRSSSIRSQYSRTSSTSTATSTSTCSNHTSSSVKTVPSTKIKSRNNFHSHPSPKPQVWASGARGNPINYATQNPISKKSTMWDVLRLGLVRAPEIEQRHRVSSASGRTIPFIIPRNDSSRSINSGSSESNSNTRGKISDVLSELHKKKNNNGGIFKSCKCSVLAIEPIPTRDIGRKSNYFGTKMLEGSKDDNIDNTTSSNIYYRFSKEDEELEQEKKVRLREQEEKLKKKQGKKVMSHYHYRTFEWLRDLSHANVLNS